nr:MAG TPA: virion morphogenesis protein [Caudoviricetes sp.]
MIEKLEGKITEIMGLSVMVGVTAKSNARSDELTNADLAMIHEFGSPAHNIPERSFLRKPLINNAEAVANLAKNAIGKFIAGEISAAEALGVIGEEAKGISKEAVTNGINPALNPATIKRKKSSKPLIDTGQLINSITYEVRK